MEAKLSTEKGKSLYKSDRQPSSRCSARPKAPGASTVSCARALLPVTANGSSSTCPTTFSRRGGQGGPGHEPPRTCRPGQPSLPHPRAEGDAHTFLGAVTVLPRQSAHQEARAGAAGHSAGPSEGVTQVLATGSEGRQFAKLEGQPPGAPESSFFPNAWKLAVECRIHYVRACEDV